MAESTMGKLVMILATNDSEFRTGLKKTLQHAERSLKRTSAQFNRIGRQLSLSLTAPLAALGVASVKAFAAQEQAEKKLRAAMKGTGKEADAMAKRLMEHAAQLQKISIFGDEEIIGQQAFLAGLGMTESQIRNITIASVEMASAIDGMSLESAFRNTAKTFAGLSGELGELIPQLRELSKEQLQAGQGAELIAKLFAGQAAAAADTTAGKISQMKNAISDLMETIGARLAPTVIGIADKMRNFAITLSQVNPQMVDLAVKMAGAIALAGPLALALGQVVNVLRMIVAVKLLPVVAGMGALVAMAGAVTAAMKDSNLEIQTTGKSFESVGTIIGKVFGFFANAIHGVRIGINVMALGVLEAVKHIANAWNWMSNAIGKVFTFAMNGVIVAMESVINFIRTKVFPLVNEGMKQASKAAAFLGIGEIGAGPAPLSTKPIQLDRLTHESKGNFFGDAMQEEVDARGDRVRALVSNWPSKQIEEKVGEFNAAFEGGGIAKTGLEEAKQPALDLAAVLGDVKNQGEKASKAAGGVGTAVEESAGRAVRALGGMRAAFEDISLGISDAARSQESLRHMSERYASSFSDRISGMLTGASGEFKNFGDVAKSVLADIASDMVRSGMRNLIGGIFGGGSGGAVFGSILSGLLGRSTGGRVAPGAPYIIGERGPELFVPDGPGGVVSNTSLGSVRKESGSSVVVNQTFESGMDEARLSQIARSIKEETTEGILSAIQRGGGFRATVQA